VYIESLASGEPRLFSFLTDDLRGVEAFFVDSRLTLSVTVRCVTQDMCFTKKVYIYIFHVFFVFYGVIHDPFLKKYIYTFLCVFSCLCCDAWSAPEFHKKSIYIHFLCVFCVLWCVMCFSKSKISTVAVGYSLLPQRWYHIIYCNACTLLYLFRYHIVISHSVGRMFAPSEVKVYIDGRVVSDTLCRYPHVPYDIFLGWILGQNRLRTGRNFQNIFCVFLSFM